MEYPLAAAAEAAGYRACHRCRPYQSPDAGAIGPEIVCRGVRMVTAGALDEHTEADLAATLGVSARHLRRVFTEHLGVTPDRLARSHRAHFARRLLDDSDLPVRDVAFAAGFGSVRQLQRAMVTTFGEPPSVLRERRPGGGAVPGTTGGLTVPLPHEGPLDWPWMCRWLAIRAITGVETVDFDGDPPNRAALRRSFEVDGEAALVELTAGDHDGRLLLRVHMPRWDDLAHLVRSARRVGATGSDAGDALEHLGADPILGELVRGRPGLRPPGCWDPFAAVVQAVLAQQVSTRAARTLVTRLVRAHGTPVAGLEELGLHLAFPGAELLAEADLSGVGLTRRRAATVRSVALAVGSGELDLEDPLLLAPNRAGGEPEVLQALQRVPGIGPWTASYVGIRMGLPDEFPVADLALREAVGLLTSGPRPSTRELAALSEAWRPHRSFAAVHLWTWLREFRSRG